MAYRIGDRVVVVRSPCPHMVGVVTTVASELIRCWVCLDSNNCWPEGTMVHVLDYESRLNPGRNVGYPPEYLELYRDDGSEKGEWTDELRKLCGGRVTA